MLRTDIAAIRAQCCVRDEHAVLCDVEPVEVTGLRLTPAVFLVKLSIHEVATSHNLGFALHLNGDVTGTRKGAVYFLVTFSSRLDGASDTFLGSVCRRRVTGEPLGDGIGRVEVGDVVAIVERRTSCVDLVRSWIDRAFSR
ncbi:hypothetical protein D3C72_1665730 [compost metagenome]